MSLLEGQIANQIFNGFKGKLLTGTLTRNVPTGATDSNGDAVTSETNYSCEGFVSSYEETFRARAGIPETDSKVNIFGKSIDVEPKKDDIVTFNAGEYWKVRRVKVDPAGALYVCQSYRIYDV